MKLKILAIIGLAVVGIGAAVVAIGGLPSSKAATTQYLTGTVATGNVTNDVAATGSVASSASYGVAFGSPAHLASAAAASGSTTWTTTDVKVKVGDVVKKGQVLATADTTDLKQQLVDANIAIDNANINYRQAKSDLSTANTAAVNSQIRQAKLSINNAKTQLASARKTRDDLLTQIKDATLTAPIDGVVTTVNVVKGLDAPSGDAIVIDSTTFEVTADVVESDLASMAVGQTAPIDGVVTTVNVVKSLDAPSGDAIVIDSTTFEVTADVVESDLASMAVGQTATVTITAVGADVTGTVTAIAPTTTGSSSGAVVSYPVTVSLTGVPNTVRAGMTADVTITIDSATNVLTVPAASLRGTAGDYTVLVMGADGTPTAQQVQVGLVTNTTAEIKSGLTAGEAVVTGVANAQTGTTNTTTGGFGGGGLGIPGGGFNGGGTRRGPGN